MNCIRWLWVWLVNGFNSMNNSICLCNTRDNNEKVGQSVTKSSFQLIKGQSIITYICLVHVMLMLPYLLLWPLSGQYFSLLTRPFSSRLVVMTMTSDFCSHTISQKSLTVSGSGPYNNSLFHITQASLIFVCLPRLYRLGTPMTKV